MALNFGQMTRQILSETYRDASFTTAVQNAIVSAIKELEINQLFINQKYVQLQITSGVDFVALPEDFIAVLQMQLVDSVNGVPGNVITTAQNGFREVTFWELKTYYPRYSLTSGSPYNWALYGNFMYFAPLPQANYFLNMYYYYRDTTYPTEDDDTSIWLGNYTQDVTRYTARGIFYRDSLQSPELAMSDFAKAEDALSKLKMRSGQRETINILSM